MGRDLIAWLVALAVIVLVFSLLARDHQRRKRRTEEEYQADVKKSGASLLGVAGLELQELFQADLEKAIYYQQDEKGGMTKTGCEGDDGERTG